MSLVIDDPELVAEVQRRSAASGRSARDVLAAALHLELVPRPAGIPAEERQKRAEEALDELCRSFRRHRLQDDHRSADEIVGYDENGLPI